MFSFVFVFLFSLALLFALNCFMFVWYGFVSCLLFFVFYCFCVFFFVWFCFFDLCYVFFIIIFDVVCFVFD